MSGSVSKRSTAKPIVAYLGRHFIERWEERVGGFAPSLDMVNQMLNDSVRLRGQRTLYRRSGETFVPHKLLAEFFIARFGLIIKVDEDIHCAVTVITVNRSEAHKCQVI